MNRIAIALNLGLASELGAEFDVPKFGITRVIYDLNSYDLSEFNQIFIYAKGENGSDIWFYEYADKLSKSGKADIYFISEDKEIIPAYIIPTTSIISTEDFYEEFEIDEQQPIDEPFTVLGHDEGNYYFFPRASGQIVSLTPGQLGTITNLFRLAPEDYWKSKYGNEKMNATKIAHNAANHLMQQCHELRIFKAENIRGVGVWQDNGRNIMHCGDFLYFSGKKIKSHALKSEYVYPARPGGLDISDVKPLNNLEANKLREICEMLSWENKLSGDLLAGWCVIAPVCAALPWRPHIWVTGESESGKSTIINDIIKPIVGPMALRVDGKTTEAGIRGSLKSDGRPIIYDEAEAETIKEISIMEGVLGLARLSSSGATVIKGTTTGGSVEYTARSAFCFSGINPAIKHRADESRISQLILQRDRKEGAIDRYEKIKFMISETINYEFSKRLLARTFQNMDSLIENIKTFSRAAAVVLNNRRAADQIGAMLAGLFSLTSRHQISYDAAVAWIKKHDWKIHTAIAEQTDPQRLISVIASATIRYKIADEKITEDTIGSMIEASKLYGNNYTVHALRSYGIWPREDGVWISNTSVKIQKILEGTPWHKWSRTLNDIQGSKACVDATFSPGIKSRSICIPYEVFGIEIDKSIQENPF